MRHVSNGFPSFMKSQRTRRNWTVAEAARALGHSPTWVLNCEAGNIREPRLQTQREIGRGFGVSLSEVRASLGLGPLNDPDVDALNATLDQLAAVLRDTDASRYPFVVEAARLIARVHDAESVE